jgi:DNA-binding CsgD family transcriptional regulator/tetratricopeptide (TPR) repeat protein
VRDPSIALASAREAVAREAWSEAYEAFTASSAEELGPADLEAFADAAWWLSKPETSIGIRQRAYGAFADAGDDLGAAEMAARLAIEHFVRREPAVGGGWLMRAQRHAEGLPEQAGHGLLLIVQATVARFSGDIDGALAITERAIELGRRFGDRDLSAMAIHTRGLLLIAAGDVKEGVALLDEAMTSVVAGELSSYFTGIVYCNVIGACLELADVQRASQWNEAALAWCESLPPESPFPGQCRLNRAEVAKLRGAWDVAETEAVRASEELMAFDPVTAAHAFYETGEIRRRVGDLEEAERCFIRASELGVDPQPGLALLRLSQGKVDAAAMALRLAASGGWEGRLRGARLLAAQVDVAIVAGDLDTAKDGCERMETLAEGVEVPVLDAMASTARGATRLAEGDVAAALDGLRRACAMWQELRLPYEGARARMLFGRALRAAGDEDDAVLELRAAAATFGELGAVPDVDAARRLIDRRDTLPRGLSRREGEVLKLVAAGLTNREIAAALVISEHTVARHLQNMFVKLDVSSRSAATAFAFEHGLA